MLAWRSANGLRIAGQLTLEAIAELAMYVWGVKSVDV